MRYEIEMKAHAREPRRIRQELDGFAVFIRDFEKSDRYFLLPGAEPGKGRNFRIRSEGGKSVVTWKNRSFEGALEVNAEHEFEVDDPEAFLGLCLSMGAKPYILKRKIGRAYEFEGTVIELSEVPPLGHFVEIERIVEAEGGAGEGSGAEAGPGEGLPRAPEASMVEDARKREAAILERLGIPDADIEARPYSLMLREAGAAGR